MADPTAPCRDTTAEIEVRTLGRIDYLRAWDLQRDLAAARADGDGPDTLLLLEHPAVYTAGRRTQPEDRPTDGTPVIDVDRGGRITWHGPGQLVGYPIIGLTAPIDVVDYVRRLEQALIAVCHDLGLTDCGRVEGRSGVWLPAGVVRGEPRPERKIAAIGIRVARGVTQHGFAINCDDDLAAFSAITPCGIADAGVASLSSELGRTVTVDDITAATARAVADALDGRLPVSPQNITRVAPADPATGTGAQITALPTIRIG